MGFFHRGGMAFANSPAGRDALFSRAYGGVAWGGDGPWIFTVGDNGQPASNHLIVQGLVNQNFVYSMPTTENLTIGFAVYINQFYSSDGTGTGSEDAVVFQEQAPNLSTTRNCSLDFYYDAIAASAKVALRRPDGVALGSSEIRKDEWTYIEAQIFHADSGIGSFEVRENGALLFSGTGITAGAGSQGSNEVVFEISPDSSSGLMKIGDIYILDSGATAPYPNDFLGPCGTASVVLSGDSVTDWDPAVGTHFTLVNNDALSEEDTGDSGGYISTDSNSAVVDLYTTFDNLPYLESSEVFGMKYLVIGRMETPGIKEVRPRFEVGGVPATGAPNPTPVFTSTEYQAYICDVDLNPVTGLPWTLADLYDSAFKFGIIQEV